MKQHLFLIHLFLSSLIFCQTPSLVKDINPGSANSKTPTITDSKFYSEINGGLLFTADDGVNGSELWFSDGTDPGTYMIKDINAGSSSSNISAFFKFNNLQYFVATSVGFGEELWVTDGTNAGTNLVKDIRTGTVGGSISNFYNTQSGYFLFTANNGINGLELWKSDGTSSGTSMISDIWPGAGSSTPNSFCTNSLGKIFFIANDGIAGQEVWSIDNTLTTPSLMMDIKTGSASSNPTNLFIVNDKCFFIADNGTIGSELYVSSGTSSSTALVKDIYMGSSSSGISYMTSYNNKLIFKALNGGASGSVWESDGTLLGTISFTLPSNVNYYQPFGIVNGKIVFVTQWCPSGCMPGVQDSTFVYGFTNTVSNCTLINKFKSKNNPGTIKAGVMTFGNKILFYKLSNVGAWSGGESYFVLSDGTSSGTSKIYVGDSYWANGNYINYDLPIINNKVFASVMTRPSFIDINGNFTQSNDYVCNSYYTYKCATLGNKLYFAAGDASTNTELWETDGTVSNTILNLDINPGNVSSFYSTGQDSYFNPFVTSTNKLFFYATDGATGYELWVINGIPTNTKENIIIENTSALLIPNPSNEECYLKLSGLSSINSEIRVDLYNYSGQKIQQINTEKLNSVNNQKIVIDTKSFSNGIYFIKILIEGKTKTLKMVVSH